MKGLTLGAVSLVFVALVCVAPAAAVGVEALIGTGPSASLLVDWAWTPWVCAGAWVGGRLATEVQTPSLTAGFGLRLGPTEEGRQAVGYVGLGIELALEGPVVSAVALPAVGVRVRMAPNTSLLGEAHYAIPLSGDAGRRIEVLLGIRFRF